MTTDLILGTAGHIDHGKTSLIRCLTGVDTDRLPEEKRRGITIDLGFAALELGEYRLGIVDVPGHEKFVRNMLAGAAGMDLALLVVAADDSIKPQTREHLEILRLLDLRAGVIAITKCDLVDSEWIDLVEEEVGQLVAGTFLEEAPVVRTSAASGLGLEALRGALEAAAGRAARARPAVGGEWPFRMAIDRAFTLAGHGTIVTGSVACGAARVGDELRIEPGGVRVRVRDLQNHDRPVARVGRGQRAAINLAGVRCEAIERGQQLASPGHLAPSRLLSVRMSLLESAARPLKHRARVRLHLGAAQLLASVLLLDRDKLGPGQSAVAQLVLGRPAAATWRQPFVLRSESPVTTIGGGRVLDPTAEKVRRRDRLALDMLRALEDSDPAVRASAALFFSGLRDWSPTDLARTAGVEDCEAMRDVLVKRGELLEIAVSPTRRRRLHRLVFERLMGRVEAALEKLHERHPLQVVFDRGRLALALPDLDDDALLDALLEAMDRAGRIRLSPRGAALAGRGPKLSQNERKLLKRLIERFREAGAQPPSVEQCRQAASGNSQRVHELIQLAAAEGRLQEIGPQLYLHADVEKELRRRLADRLAGGDALTLSQIRELLGTTRKYAVPYCEFLDRIGFTRREGDLRVLAQNEPRS